MKIYPACKELKEGLIVSADRSATKTETKGKSPVRKAPELKKDPDVKEEKKVGGPKKKPTMGPKRRMAQIRASRARNVSGITRTLVKNM